MKTDWEAVVRDLKVTANTGQLETICELIKRHTRRTEEDLPKSAWHWVRMRGDQGWNLAYFGMQRGVCHVYTFGGYRLDEHWYNESRLEFEIGPEIVPPEEES